LDFSDDKMLVGRTFSYSDTQRYRVGANYLQLPVNSPKNSEHLATNQRDGQMAFYVDTGGENPHVNYEPSALGGLSEAEEPRHDEVGPLITGRLTRARIPRTNDYLQAGQRYRLMEQWERDDLVHNFVTLLSQCEPQTQQRMVWHLLLVEDELGLRVGEGLGIRPDDVRHLQPLPKQKLTDDDRDRLANLGKNGPRNVAGLKMTHCVPNERVEVQAVLR
jgi:catalase